MKRAHRQDPVEAHPAKVRRIAASDRISELSDELFVRILSFLPVPALLLCQSVSKKFSYLAVDSELWKAAYYHQFVLPRASRIPGIKIKEAGATHRLHYSSRLSKWLDDGALVKDGVKTHWKQQYRLRYNWAQGQCAVKEIVVTERAPDPPALVMLSSNTVFAADAISGLRAWSSRERKLLAITPVTIAEAPRLPLSMSISDGDGERAVLGFEDGSFSIYALRRDVQGVFECLFTHPPSTNGALSALAYAAPYLLTMTENHLISLYLFDETVAPMGTLGAPQLLYSLRSHTTWPPVSLSLRTSTTGMTAAIAYSIPTYLSGWTVVVQELKISLTGELLESRLATAADENSFTLSAYRSPSPSSTRPSSSFLGSAPDASYTPGPNRSKPISMSYSHPYLLVAHPDNTLSLYLVKSTSSSLSISSGERLWGHTSSISGAHIGTRGKAVSVSRLGDELRVWDLEGGVASWTHRKRFRNGEISVRIQPSKVANSLEDDHVHSARSSVGLRFALDQTSDHSTVSHGWVGFDEQNVIVLREKNEGSQALVVYDFT